ncbi:L-tyrosine 3-hydroxylase [Amycolatopsis orientalis]|uniref:L-tyrosine 3-hydroxylase n=1 Tax=Amycolatopsis orientalis TaxID=31958 RepID=UPI000A691318|nr:L-tyrosine 3-hydroxylase [Amycolatopsis orientalis]
MVVPVIPRLVVPLPLDEFGPCQAESAIPAGALPRQRAATCPAALNVQPVPPPPSGSEAEFAWYRWILGHHGSFVAWRLLSSALDRRDTDEAAALFDAYSALLLYAGSCTPAVYATVIRPRMMARHPAMSGTWARDYRHITAQLSEFVPESGSTLKEALKFNRLVHMTVAHRLVPIGKSLLRDAGHDVHEAPTEEEQEIVDDFFLMDRAPNCVAGFVAALRARISAIIADARLNPVTEIYDRQVVNRFQEDLPEHISRVVSIAEATLLEGVNA